MIEFQPDKIQFISKEAKDLINSFDKSFYGFDEINNIIYIYFEKVSKMNKFMKLAPETIEGKKVIAKYCGKVKPALDKN